LAPPVIASSGLAMVIVAGLSLLGSIFLSSTANGIAGLGAQQVAEVALDHLRKCVQVDADVRDVVAVEQSGVYRGQYHVLVATDVAARGLDVADVEIPTPSETRAPLSPDWASAAHVSVRTASAAKKIFVMSANGFFPL
jgi:hypothetical protein